MTVSQNKFQISESDRDDLPEVQIISENLRLYVEDKFGPANQKPYVAIVRNENGDVLGGLKGHSHWRWLYIQRLWVSDTVRSQGFGSQLLKLAEAEAKKRQDIGLYVDTFEEKTRDFYLFNGFEEVGQIADFPEGSTRFFLAKRV